uniref:PRELI/MSF1 domain-containing protein n=1 Tax=Capra hircus TaxID=9925 RepID=A0A8C2RCM5_CAPHI
MVKYFLGQSVLRMFPAFWQLYPNPYSKHVLTEDTVHREVTSDQTLLSRRLLTKMNRMPRWAERLFPANVAHSHILEDSIMDPQKPGHDHLYVNHALWLPTSEPGRLTPASDG